MPKASLSRLHHGSGRVQVDQLDPTPLELPAGCARPRTLEETIARYMHIHLMNEREGSDPESWEDADDFEEDEDPDVLIFHSKYELKELENEFDDTYNPDRTPLAASEAPQEKIAKQPGPQPGSQEETPSGASE